MEKNEVIERYEVVTDPQRMTRDEVIKFTYDLMSELEQRAEQLEKDDKAKKQWRRK